MSLMVLASCAWTAGRVNPCQLRLQFSTQKSWVHFKTWLCLPHSVLNKCSLEVCFQREGKRSGQGQGFKPSLRHLHCIHCLLCWCPSILSLETWVPRRRVPPTLFCGTSLAGCRQCPGLLAQLFLGLLQWLSCPPFWVIGSTAGSFINYDQLAVSNGLQMEPPVGSPQGDWQRLEGGWGVKGRPLLNARCYKTKQISRNRLSLKDSFTFAPILT